MLVGSDFGCLLVTAKRSRRTARMITEFEDFCLWVYVVVDDIWKRLGPLFRRPGPEPRCSDPELIAMTIIGECRGWVSVYGR